MSLTAHAGDHLHVIGDSITVQGWDKATGGFRDQMAAGMAALVRPPATTYWPAQQGGGSRQARQGVGSRSSIVRPSWRNTQQLYFTSQGGNSFSIENINTNYTNLFVTPFLPIDTAVLFCVVNNQFTDPATHLADYGAFLDRLRSDGVKQVLCIGGFLFQFTGEQWSGSPAAFNSGLTLTHPIEANVAAACAARAGWTEYCPLVPTTLAYEVANNTPSPGVVSGILSLDGVHPNPTGQVLIGTQAAGHFTFQP